MYWDYFNFHNYSTVELDVMNFILAFFLCLVITYYGWKAKQETNINPKWINLGVILFIFADIIYESYSFTWLIIFAKLIFTFVCCFLLQQILNKIFQ